MMLDEAVDHVSSWLACPMVACLEPSERHWEVLSQSLIGSQATANLVGDAHIAVLAIEYGLTLCSTDQDFSRFKGLHWENPL